MTTRTRSLVTRTLAAASAATVLTLGLAGSAQAADYVTMNAAELEQAVLRAQMPKTLGSWTQNYYVTDTDTSMTTPTVCWNDKGDVTLPSSKNMGAVGYALRSGASGVVTIYQYEDESKAKAALEAMRNADCTDMPTVVNEGGKKVKGNSGGDFTDASMTSVNYLLSYPEGKDSILEFVQTTQKGHAIIQTEVTTSSSNALSDKKKQAVITRFSNTNKAWHKNVVRAYENFGQGNSR